MLFCTVLSCLTLCDLWIVGCQTPLSMGFSRQEYWIGLPCLLQGILLTQESHLYFQHLLHCSQILYPLSYLGSPEYVLYLLYSFFCQWTFRLLPCLATISSVAMNTGVHVSFQTILFSLTICPEVRLQDHM